MLAHVIQCVFIAVSNIITIVCSLTIFNNSCTIIGRVVAGILLSIGVALMILDIVLIVALILGWW